MDFTINYFKIKITQNQIENFNINFKNKIEAHMVCRLLHHHHLHTTSCPSLPGARCPWLTLKWMTSSYVWEPHRRYSLPHSLPTIIPHNLPRSGQGQAPPRLSTNPFIPGGGLWQDGGQAALRPVQWQQTRTLTWLNLVYYKHDKTNVPSGYWSISHQLCGSCLSKILLKDYFFLFFIQLRPWRQGRKQ